MTKRTTRVTKQQDANLDTCPLSIGSQIDSRTVNYAPPTNERREIVYTLSGKPEVPGHAARTRACVQLALNYTCSSSDRAETPVDAGPELARPAPPALRMRAGVACSL